MADQRVIKFNPKEADWEVWDPIDPTGLISGDPVQRGNEYFRTHGGKVYAGIWDCTAYQYAIEPYAVHEFMLILEGSITLIDADNKEHVFHQGQSFVIPKGFNCSWKQHGYVKKFYVIFEDDREMDSSNGQADTPILVDPDLPLAAMTGLNADDFVGDLPDMSIETFYQDGSNQFTVGVWESTAMTRVPGTIGRSELMHILSGKGAVINGDGERFEFEAGDTFLVPVNMGYQWTSDEPVKKIFCSFTPG